MTTSPHDALFKAAFGRPDIARSELALVLPKEVTAQIDLATLDLCPGSFVDEELQHTHSDLLFSVRARNDEEAFVYVLFEHQSSFDATMPFRLLRYVVRVWERWLRDHPDETRLPIVVPVLLHHGDAAWRASPELASMFDRSPVFDSARPHLPLFRFVLDDLAALTPATISARALDALPRLVQLALWASRSLARLRQAAPAMRAIIEALGEDDRTRSLLRQLFLYMLGTTPDVAVADVRTILFDVAGARRQEDVMTAGEQLRLMGSIQALRNAVPLVLAARRVALSERGKARIDACDDVPTLNEWLGRAATAQTEAEIFTGNA